MTRSKDEGIVSDKATTKACFRCRGYQSQECAVRPCGCTCHLEDRVTSEATPTAICEGCNARDARPYGPGNTQRYLCAECIAGIERPSRLPPLVSTVDESDYVPDGERVSAEAPHPTKEDMAAALESPSPARGRWWPPGSRVQRDGYGQQTIGTVKDHNPLLWPYVVFDDGSESSIAPWMLKPADESEDMKQAREMVRLYNEADNKVSFMIGLLSRMHGRESAKATGEEDMVTRAEMSERVTKAREFERDNTVKLIVAALREDADKAEVSRARTLLEIATWLRNGDWEREAES